MNKLNTFLSFVLLSFCLLINVSYAEFSSTSVGLCGVSTQSISKITFADTYTSEQIHSFYKSTDETARNQMLDTMYDAGYYVLWIPQTASEYYTVIFKTNQPVDLGATNASSKFIIRPCLDEGSVVYYLSTSSPKGATKITTTSTGVYNFAVPMFATYTFTAFENAIASNPRYYGNFPYLKQLTEGTINTYTWNGEYYFYNKISTEPEQPTMPTNAEIASAVQAFYNSDYYKNNKDFKDFIVLLNTTNNNISIIGHNFASQLAQCIVPANYEYDGESYNQDWWRFYLRGITDQINATLFEKYYWLYSTTDLGETINYNGKGYMNELLDVRFTTQSIIIYSTTDYFVQTFEKDEEGVYWPETGTIPGNQYTYDETLDPTENQYNPIKDYIPTNPIQSILGDFNFDEINKVFEENKGILNIENASWLFTANNKLVGYFIGFLSLLIVFLIMLRLLGG